MYNGHIQFLQTLDSLIFTCFTYSIIIHKPLNIIYTLQFIFNILHIIYIYNYQGELVFWTNMM